MSNKGAGQKAQLTRRLLIPVLALIILLMLAACGSSSKYTAEASAVQVIGKSSGAYDAAAAPSASASPVYGEPGIGGVNNRAEETSQYASQLNELMSQRKLIMEGDVSIETLNFDESIEALDQLVEDLGGFTEVRNVRGKSSRTYYSLRSASYVIRIPAESFDLAMKNMGTIGNVLESTSKGTDITDTYVDTQTRIKTLKVQEETLLDLLSKAEKLEDVITLEGRISDVRYQIESLENTIKNYDRLVEFSRITVFIQEVDDETRTRPNPKTLGERISESFRESIDSFVDFCEDFLVWLVRSWISILIIAVGVFAAAMIVRSKMRKSGKPVKKAETEPDKKE